MNIKSLTSLVFVLVLASCTKEASVPNNNNVSNPMMSLVALSSGYHLTTTSAAIASDMQDAEYEFTVIHTSNFGETVDVIAGGVIPSGPTVYVNNIQMNPFSGDSYLLNDVPISLFDNTVTLKDNSNDTLMSLQVPKIIQARKLGDDNSLDLQISEHPTLTWEMDDSNPTGQVAIYIKYYEDANLNSAPIDTKLFIVDDLDEAFDITTDFVSGAVAINLQLVRGNAKNFSYSTSDYILFNVRSSDHHFYIMH